MRRSGIGLGLSLAAIVWSGTAMSEESFEILSFADQNGWEQDDHASALSVFRVTCRDLQGPDWGPLCALADTAPNPRSFFELFFRPVLIGGTAPALFTGYYEPELQGARSPSARYRYPVYRTPPEAREGPWATRRDIDEGGLLAGRGLEIAWVDDPVDLFFLHIQGSGRIRLTDGATIRVGYDGRNGQPYRSIGQELIRRGVYEPHQVSAQVIRNWVRRNPAQGRELLFHNPSYIFFREVHLPDPGLGPLGAMNRSITPLRSIAVDPAHTPLGAPVWIEKDGAGPMRRLMIAQDTGGAIKGAQRADIFFGFGDGAGLAAGQIRDPGRMIVLLPIELAHQRAPDA
jgi:membrane-bound lytic murein transglycosylase A